jgi:hypothetical protein
MKVAQKPRGIARFRRYELVSVWGIWQWRHHSCLLSPRAFFGVSFRWGRREDAPCGVVGLLALGEMRLQPALNIEKAPLPYHSPAPSEPRAVTKSDSLATWREEFFEAPIR